MLRQFVLLLCFVVLMLCSIHGALGRLTGAKGSGRQCLTDDQLAKAIISLSGQYDKAQAAQHLLRQSSSRSSECRQQVVDAVMNAMDRPDLDISRDQVQANLWREGAVLLGDLKAEQSLDLLLSHIKIMDGEWSTTMTHQPAVEGIIRMGPVAILKLTNLLQNQDWKTRHYAVYCLASIGGLSAQRAIEAAALNESIPCVRRFMLTSIQTMDVKHGGLKKDHGEWAKAFMCMS
jgi:HEAT repeat protein